MMSCYSRLSALVPFLLRPRRMAGVTGRGRRQRLLLLLLRTLRVGRHSSLFKNGTQLGYPSRQEDSVWAMGGKRFVSELSASVSSDLAMRRPNN